ncbi:MAG: hypothetical protein ACI82A_002148, partial [Candidatus Azotimanducaceae bacterium]
DQAESLELDRSDHPITICAEYVLIQRVP